MTALKIESDAVEVRAGRSDAKVLVTCEHASQRMPDGWAWPERDRRLVDTHWAYDLGAADMARDFAAAMGAAVVLSRYSRLLVDPNRPEDSDTLFRTHAEGETVELNTTHLHAEERARRVQRLLRPYHATLDEEVAASRAPTLVSIHTFTPVYEGQPRTLEVGVLYDRDEALAERVAQVLVKAGLNAALNEPYSGKEGLMYAVDRHARAHGRQSIEFEVRQDLATDPAFRRDFDALLLEIFG
ncbi:MAG: N-formylglutamate amidohydrolase [Sandaracinaceae bacterium]